MLGRTMSPRTGDSLEELQEAGGLQELRMALVSSQQETGALSPPTVRK